VPDKHVDVVEDDPAPAAIGDDAIPHVCDPQDNGAPSLSGTTPFLLPISILVFSTSALSLTCSISTLLKACQQATTQRAVKLHPYANFLPLRVYSHFQVSS
jgi:hypothetical protein